MIVKVYLASFYGFSKQVQNRVYSQLLISHPSQSLEPVQMFQRKVPNVSLALLI